MRFLKAVSVSASEPPPKGTALVTLETLGVEVETKEYLLILPAVPEETAATGTSVAN